MSAVTIKIECDDLELAAALTASISKGLEMDDFMHVAVKVGMLTLDPAVARAEQEFTQISELGIHGRIYRVRDNPPKRANIAHLIRPHRMELHPTCVEGLRQRAASKLLTPIVIDYGSKAEEDGRYIAKLVDFSINPEVLP